MEMLEVFNLTRLADHYAGTLSGGQLKLLELSRALMASPDSSSRRAHGGINPTLGRRLLDHMQRLRTRRSHVPLHRARHGGGHEPSRPRGGDGGGPVIADGQPHEVRSDQAVIDAYLGVTASPDGGIGASGLEGAPTAVTARCSSPTAWSPATCPRWTS